MKPLPFVCIPHAAFSLLRPMITHLAWDALDVVSFGHYDACKRPL